MLLIRNPRKFMQIDYIIANTEIEIFSLEKILRTP